MAIYQPFLARVGLAAGVFWAVLLAGFLEFGSRYGLASARASHETVIVAVSGGVDSVVLLDTLVQAGDYDIIVAHVDHGIRDDSAADARFVQALAERYELAFFMTELRLGAGASEDAARTKRYDFLEQLAAEHKAKIATAHHRDDVIGSVAINLTRGTGWRGLAVMNRAHTSRPLLQKTKAELYDYAAEKRLEWVEDSTNSSPRYLRNRLRADVLLLAPETAENVMQLRNEQIKLSGEISTEAARLAGLFGNQRYPFTVVDAAAVKEILRIKLGAQESATLDRVLLAIKVGRPGTVCEVSQRYRVRLHQKTFVVEEPHQ